MKKRKFSLSFVKFLASGVLLFVIIFELKYFSYSSAIAKPNLPADCPGPGCPSLDLDDHLKFGISPGVPEKALSDTNKLIYCARLKNMANTQGSNGNYKEAYRLQKEYMDTCMPLSSFLFG